MIAIFNSLPVKEGAADEIVDISVKRPIFRMILAVLLGPHAAFLVVVSLATGIVSEDSLMTMAGPVTFIVEFGLAGVITWLIVRPRAGRLAPSDEELANRDAALEDDARQRVRAIEQQDVDAQRLERLTAEVAQWRTARDLREYATQALSDLGDGDVHTADGGSLRAELQWALDYADTVDPLRREA